MSKTVIVGRGTHYENAKGWVIADPGDSIEMPDGTLLTLVEKNPKSAVCTDKSGERVNVPLKKILPHGSDRYVTSVVRQLQDELPVQPCRPSFLDVYDRPTYGCKMTMPLARRIIRACMLSTNPKQHVLDYLEGKISKADSKLSVEQKQTAAKIALSHLLGDFPCPMHDDNEYAVAEWKSFDTWFFRHNKTKQLIASAELFDKIIEKKIGQPLYSQLFKYRMARTATDLASSLKSCLDSWFSRADSHELKDMFEAYDYLQTRLDSQCDRMEFVLKHKEIFSAETPAQYVTDLLLQSRAQDLLKPILVTLHGLSFGSGIFHPLPEFADLSSGNVNIQDVRDAMKADEEAKENRSNEFARQAAADVVKVAGTIEEISSQHLPYINRCLKEAGCKKIEKGTDSKGEYIRFHCGGRFLKVPHCDQELITTVAKQYICALADLVNPIITNTEFDNCIELAEKKTKAFIRSFDQTCAA
ncbi:hypothetical protein ACU8KO_002582 [Vibrio alginolyticus]